VLTDRPPGGVSVVVATPEPEGPPAQEPRSSDGGRAGDRRLLGRRLLVGGRSARPRRSASRQPPPARARRGVHPCRADGHLDPVSTAPVPPLPGPSVMGSWPVAPSYDVRRTWRPVASASFCSSSVRSGCSPSTLRPPAGTSCTRLSRRGHGRGRQPHQRPHPRRPRSLDACAAQCPAGKLSVVTNRRRRAGRRTGAR